MHKRSDLIIAAVTQALDRQRNALDGFTGLSQVAVIVHFDERHDIVRQVILRPEFKDDGRSAYTNGHSTSQARRG